MNQKIKLTDFEAATLSKKDMRQIVGGSCSATCGCGCQYADKGGSSTVDNGVANAETGASSKTDNDKIFLPPLEVVA